MGSGYGENMEQKIKQDEIFIGQNIRRIRKAKGIRQTDMVTLTCPRQHRHLKRKDSIRFLVSLVFSNFFIYTGCRKELAPNCRICVKIYSKAARPLSNLSGVSGNTLPASDNRLLHGSVFGYKISICTQIPRSWLPPGCGNAVRLTIPVLTSPRSSPSAHCPSSPLSGSCC